MSPFLQTALCSTKKFKVPKVCSIKSMPTSLLIVCELCHKPFSTIAMRIGYLGNTKGRPSQTASTAIGTCHDFFY